MGYKIIPFSINKDEEQKEAAISSGNCYNLSPIPASLQCWYICCHACLLRPMSNAWLLWVVSRNKEVTKGFCTVFLFSIWKKVRYYCEEWTSQWKKSMMKWQEVNSGICGLWWGYVISEWVYAKIKDTSEIVLIWIPSQAHSVFGVPNA